MAGLEVAGRRFRTETDYQAALLVGNPKLRYTEENDMFSLPDALLLHSIIRKYKPKRIIEIEWVFYVCYP